MVYTQDGTALIQSSLNFAIMFISMKSRSESKPGHVGSKIRSLGQILEKLCTLNRRYSFDPIFTKQCENVCLQNSGHDQNWVMSD